MESKNCEEKLENFDRWREKQRGWNMGLYLEWEFSIVKFGLKIMPY